MLTAQSLVVLQRGDGGFHQRRRIQAPQVNQPATGQAGGLYSLSQEAAHIPGAGRRNLVLSLRYLPVAIPWKHLDVLLSISRQQFSQPPTHARAIHEDQPASSLSRAAGLRRCHRFPAQFVEGIFKLSGTGGAMFSDRQAAQLETARLQQEFSLLIENVYIAFQTLRILLDRFKRRMAPDLPSRSPVKLKMAQPGRNIEGLIAANQPVRQGRDQYLEAGI